MKKENIKAAIAFEYDGKNMLIVSEKRDWESKSDHCERIAMMIERMIKESKKSKGK